MNSKSFLLLVLLCFFNASLSQAGEAIALLTNFLDKAQTIHSDFKQTLVDAKGIQLQESAGVFALKRPGKFSWDYEAPYPQKIISNGYKIWVYDEELEQVSVKKYSEILAGSPVILLDQKKDLNVDFNVEDSGFKYNQYWITLMPKISDNEFQKIEVGMIKGGMKTMRLYDGFDQVTVIEFENLKINSELSDKQFNFNPPEGTDIVGDF